MNALAFLPRNLRKPKAAAYVGVSVPAFERMVSNGEMPSPFTLSGAEAWDIRDLDRAVDDLKAGATPQQDWRRNAPSRA